jgi:hypothetical protein
MTARPGHDRSLPPIAVEVLAGIYQHRLLSTTQLHALYTPQAQPRWTRRVLALLQHRALVDRVRGPGPLSLWFLTDTGADTVETAGPRAELRRRVTTPAQAEGPLRAHTIAVNDVGIAFVHAARQHGDECGPESWRNEVAHPITQARGRRPAELLITDALLTYLQTSKDGSLTLHQRFVELDRGTYPAEQLASKITRYTQLRHYTPDTATNAKPLWRAHYRAWPHLLIVLADQPPQRIHQRIQRTLALHASDPTTNHNSSIPVLFVALGDLTDRGPFAAIFTTAEQPGKPVDWLGQPQPTEGTNHAAAIT